MKYCGNCGKEVNPGAAVCLNCGHAISDTLFSSTPSFENIEKPKSGNKGLATVSVVMGSLGFWPLIFVGSITGLILGIIGMNDKDNPYKGRAKIGFWLSISSLAFWLFVIVITIMNGGEFRIDTY